MDVGGTLRRTRRRAGLSQRALAAHTGVAQPTIARVEGGLEVPRVDTLDRLLRACGEALEVVPAAGTDVDRTAIRELLRMTPAARAASLVTEARAVARIEGARRVR